MTQLKEVPQTSIRQGCCPGAPREVTCAPEGEAKRWARIFKALADPTRVQILSLVARREGGVCECEIVGCTPLSQPTISYHVKMLKEAGLLDVEKQGSWRYFRLRKEVLLRAAAALGDLTE
jgi:ArsR family transcriptional regulator